MAHEDWLGEVVTILTQLELADKTPINVGLNQAPILLGTDALNIHYEDDFGKQQEKKDRKVVQSIVMAGRDNR